MIQPVLLLVFYLFVLGNAHAAPCRGDKNQLKAKIRRVMEEDPRLIPVFVRAAFHDCITATKDKPASGCNGSLRLPKERDNHRNDEIRVGLELLDEVLPGTCVSYADGIQLGMLTAMDLASKGSFPKLNIRTGIPDSDSPDTLSELPQRRANFTELKELYRRKGFNSKELVASVVGAHSLGRFFSGQEEERNFTTKPFDFNIDYATNLVQRIESGRNLPGFHTIPGDLFLLDSPEAVRWLRFFAGQKGHFRYSSSTYDAEKGLRRLTQTFARFLEKNSFITGARVKD